MGSQPGSGARWTRGVECRTEAYRRSDLVTSSRFVLGTMDGPRRCQRSGSVCVSMECHLPQESSWAVAMGDLRLNHLGSATLPPGICRRDVALGGSERSIPTTVCQNRSRAVASKSGGGEAGRQPLERATESVASASKRSMSARTTSRLERQNSGWRMSIPKRSASVAGSYRPVELRRSS
jgi:hypothetical protein